MLSAIGPIPSTLQVQAQPQLDSFKHTPRRCVNNAQQKTDRWSGHTIFAAAMAPAPFPAPFIDRFPGRSYGLPQCDRRLNQWRRRASRCRRHPDAGGSMHVYGRYSTSCEGLEMKVLVPVKRVIDYNVKIRVK